ncbi:MAG: DegV family protein [bacterium]|nr:DegV family protein [bacterium]
MDTLLLNGNDLYKAFIAGANKLISQRAHLNKINVFPVADGDTGTNMGYLMQTIVLEAKMSPSASETMESIANAALNGSRGNSGIIFSEYLNGLFEAVKGKVSVSTHEFAEAATLGIKRAYLAMMNPVEGTILTVLRKAFDHNKTDNFNVYFKESLQKAKIALEETPKELKVLADNKVVDAGAAGFTAFLEGIHSYFETGLFGSVESIELEEDVIEFHDMEITERYCTEGMILNPTLSKEQLKELFEKEGSSLIVSGRADKMRLHIHTDRPDQFFLKLAGVGQIVEQKVDDMARQVEAIKEGHPRVAVVTDSIADLPEFIMDDYSIHLVPVNLLVDGVNFLDKVTISSETFYDILKNATSVSSAQPSQKAIERSLDFLVDHYDEIVVVTVASKLSGTYNSFVQYAKTHPKVHVFDSRQNSGAEGLVALEAAKLAVAGKSAKEITALLDDFTSRTKIYVSMDTLKYMVRQGRISKFKGILAKVMNMKPVIGLGPDGAGVIIDKAFNRRATFKKINALLLKHKVIQYSIVHAGAASLAESYALEVQALTGIKPLFITNISPIVAMNAGIGSVAIAVTYESWNEL